MNRKKSIILALTSLIIAFFLFSYTQKREGFVSKHGQLSIDGIHLVDKDGKPFQMKGMSFFWSQWMGQYWTNGVVKTVSRQWKSSIIRAALGADESNGYITNPVDEMAKLETVIRAAIKQDIYVIIDWHSHHAEDHLPEAKEFFANMAKKYGHNPHIIYEVYNEPLTDWPTIKSYAQEVIDTIRHHDPDNVIVVGTPQWSQLVTHAANDPIKDKNTCYTLHFYAATHKQSLRDEAQAAIDKGICLFVTEFGTCKASGNGELNIQETELWMDFMDKYHISWCNWSISDKEETASILIPQSNTYGNWLDEMLTPSGRYIRDKIKGKEIDPEDYKLEE